MANSFDRWDRDLLLRQLMLNITENENDKKSHIEILRELKKLEKELEKRIKIRTYADIPETERILS